MDIDEGAVAEQMVAAAKLGGLPPGTECAAVGKMLDGMEHATAAPGRASPIGLAADTPLHLWPTNIDPSTPRGRALIGIAMSPGDYEMGKDGVVEIVVTHWLCYPDEYMHRESGEVRRGTRTVLIDRDGKTWRTMSDSAPKRMAAFMKLYSAAEWKAGVPFVVRRRRNASNDRDYYDIRPVLPPE